MPEPHPLTPNPNPPKLLMCVQAGVLPSGEALGCLPNTLVALCLNTGGLERVQSSHALEVFVDVFTSRTYQRCAAQRPPVSSISVMHLVCMCSGVRWGIRGHLHLYVKTSPTYQRGAASALSGFQLHVDSTIMHAVSMCLHMILW